MIELHHDQIVRIGASLGRVQTSAGAVHSLLGSQAPHHRILTWTQQVQRLPPGAIGEATLAEEINRAIDLRHGQAVQIEGRRYTAIVTDRIQKIALVPHDPSEASEVRRR